MGVVFSAAAASIHDDDDDVTLCSMEAAKCLQAVFKLPCLPFALGVFETLVSPRTHAHTHVHTHAHINTCMHHCAYYHTLSQVDLLESMLKLGVACFSHTHSALRSAVSPALYCVLEYYASLEEMLGNKKKLFTATCKQLLHPALRLSCLLQGREGDAGVAGGVARILRSLFRRFVDRGRFEFLI